MDTHECVEWTKVVHSVPALRSRKTGVVGGKLRAGFWQLKTAYALHKRL